MGQRTSFPGTLPALFLGIVLTLACAVLQQDSCWQECLLHGDVNCQANRVLLTMYFELDVKFLHSLFSLLNQVANLAVNPSTWTCTTHS